jgi:GTPase SAR1 family protein
MIAEDYFHLRAQLGTALFALSRVADDLNAEPEAMETLRTLGASLREPFSFIAIGEAKSGKSSLLNALFGREFCGAKGQPADKICAFKYGGEARDANVSERFAELSRPFAFLRDFNVIDTPDAGSIAGEQRLGAELVPGADLVFVVFSITNPWPASTWELLKSLDKKWLAKFVFVVQQADSRSEVEAQAVIKHVEQNLRDKFEAKFPVFAVSAKKALLAKTTAADRARLLAESGFDKLEAYIDETVARGETRMGRLRAVAQTAQTTLGTISGTVREAIERLKKDTEKLTTLQLSIEDRKEQSLRQVGGMLWNLTQSWERVQKLGEESLQRSLSMFETCKLIFARSAWAEEFREQTETKLRETLKLQADHAVELLCADLKNVWQQLRDALPASLALEIGTPIAEPNFAAMREQLMEQIGTTLREKMSAVHVEDEMTLLFAATGAWMRAPAALVAAGVLATGAAAFLGSPMVSAAGAATGVALLLAVIVAVGRQNKIRSRFRAAMSQSREEVLAPIEDHLRHAVELFYQDLQNTFQPLQSFCAAQRKMYEPFVTRIRQLEETLGKCAAELGVTKK